jgi:hypothetical protein
MFPDILAYSPFRIEQTVCLPDVASVELTPDTTFPAVIPPEDSTEESVENENPSPATAADSEQEHS